VRNVVFDSITSVLKFDTCLQATAVNNIIDGKAGHASFLSLRSYGTMFR
jgi:hypothetical protein